MSNVKLNETIGKEEKTKDGKKPFNKKKWREEKYSVKAKVKKWEEKRKKNMLGKYRKELRKSGIEVDGKHRNGSKETTISQFKRAEMEYKRMQEEKRKKKEEFERIKNEKNEAIKAYKEKKAARFKKLSQKTSKGQPVMRGRIELLLEKIEKNYANQNTWKTKADELTD